MKINLPVTQHEVELQEHALIVSKTDLKGQITYINRDFLQISGFSEDELIGRSHNIVRHPDMPVEAFEDFWRALKGGRPWVGLVKNRCKNGDYYWVEAHAAPIVEDGKITGYLSVRRKAAQADIKTAEAAYALFRDGKAGGLMIRDGKVVKGGLVGAVRSGLANLKVRNALLLAMTILTAIVLAQGYLGIANVGEAHDATENLYQKRLKPSVALADMAAVQSEARSQVMLALLHAPENPASKLHDHPLSAHLDALDKAIGEGERLRKVYAEHVAAATPEHQALFAGFVEAADALVSAKPLPMRRVLGRCGPRQRSFHATSPPRRTLSYMVSSPAPTSTEASSAPLPLVWTSSNL